MFLQNSTDKCFLQDPLLPPYYAWWLAHFHRYKIYYRNILLTLIVLTTVNVSPLGECSLLEARANCDLMLEQSNSQQHFFFFYF